MADRSSRQGVKKTLRLLLLLAFLLISLLILLVVLQLTESALSIWQMLEQMSPALLVFYAAGLLGLLVLISVVTWLLLRPRQSGLTGQRENPLEPIDRSTLDKALEEAQSAGVDIQAAQEEIRELDRRVETAKRHVVFFGAVSAGKSALIRAITGQRDIQVDPRTGTTREITHYPYVTSDLPELLLTDAPGILDLDKQRVALAREEARRADLIIYVCDGELTRDQFQELNELQRFQRPLLVALNKPDRYSETELATILHRLAEQLPGVELVVVQAGGQENLVRVDTEGRESTVVRDRPAQFESLLQAIRNRFEQEAERLTQLRDESLMRLGAEKLAQATDRHRQEQSERLVKGYARKAMVGAMAAVSPGTDVLVQGYLGVQMVRELSELHGVKAHQADMDEFVHLAGQQVGKRLTLLLALSGNVLKAFPGIGTVTGGLIHAVAYGMIFEGLGKAVSKTLQESGSLERAQALNYFEEAISGDLEGRAKDFARLAWQEFIARK
jgi:small GTP-binding protein